MLAFDPSSWSPWIGFLHVLGVAYVLGFVIEFFRLRRLARAADRDAAALERYNAAIRGFPHSFYAKMLGHGPRR